MLRVDFRDAEAIADDRVRRRTPPLAKNAPRPRRLHNVVHGQKIRGVAKFRDDCDFVVEHALCFFSDPVGIPALHAFFNKSDKGILRRRIAHARLVGKFVFKLVERKGAPVEKVYRFGDYCWKPPKHSRHLRRRLQMPFDIRFKLPARRFERQVFPDARHNILQCAAFGCVADNVIDCDQRDTSIACNFSKARDASRIITAIKHSGREPNRGMERSLLHPSEQGCKRTLVDTRRRHDNKIKTCGIFQEIIEK